MWAADYPMNKLVEHLQKHLEGEVVADQAALEYFATDGSIFKIRPRLIVYPKDTADVRKTVRFSWQLAERGQQLPVTARGKGTDQTGAAIGSGTILVMPAHMNRLLGFDKNNVVVQPGIIFGELQKILHSHGRFLPPYPASLDYSTVGGAVANNAGGEKSVKYGSMRDYVLGLEAVLANGQAIQTGKLSPKELNAKKGQTDFEGQVYRELDGLLTDNRHLLERVKTSLGVSKNASGYGLWEVRAKDGSVDLSKLLVGSQGTLAVVTAVRLATLPLNPKTHLVAALLPDIESTVAAILALRGLKPSALEIVDAKLLEKLRKQLPLRVEGIIEGEDVPAALLLAEFDNPKDGERSRVVKKALKLLSGMAAQAFVATKPEEQEHLWAILRGAAAKHQSAGARQALPAVEDAIVPLDKLAEFWQAADKLFDAYKLATGFWGHGGDGNLHLEPMLDIGSVGDRQMLLRLMDEFYGLVIGMGGSISAEHGDGRLRAPYLEDMYGNELYELFKQTKQIFDPHNILNPGVKLGFTKAEMMSALRQEYSLAHLHDHMPHH